MSSLVHPICSTLRRLRGLFFVLLHHARLACTFVVFPLHFSVLSNWHSWEERERGGRGEQAYIYIYVCVVDVCVCMCISLSLPLSLALFLPFYECYDDGPLSYTVC